MAKSFFDTSSYRRNSRFAKSNQLPRFACCQKGSERHEVPQVSLELLSNFVYTDLGSPGLSATLNSEGYLLKSGMSDTHAIAG